MPKNIDLLERLCAGAGGDYEFKAIGTAFLQRSSFDDLARRAMDIAERHAYAFRPHYAPGGRGLIDSLFVSVPQLEP